MAGPQPIPFTRPLPPGEQARRGFRVTRGEDFSAEELQLDKFSYPAERVDALYVKLEDYINRARTSADPRVVRDAIFKIATTDMLLREQDGIVCYFDAYDYGMDGIEQYGLDTLIPSREDLYASFDEFDSAYRAIQGYLIGGNNGVEGGSGLPML